MDFQTVAIFCAGVLALIVGAYALVEGGVKVARILGIPSVVVGLTVVAFGTSAPEFFVSLIGALRGSTALVLGNVIGSNVANLGLILAISGLLRPLVVGRDLARKEIPLMCAATVLFVVLAWDGTISRVDAGLLSAGFLVFMVWTLRRKRPPDESAECNSPTADDKTGAPLDLRGILFGALLTGTGILGLALGGKLITDSAVAMATSLGISESIIGLTMVAVGTSLPELATTVMAGVRREGDLALGNIVGSNLFNLLGVAGPVGLIRPLVSDPSAAPLLTLGPLVVKFQFQVVTLLLITFLVLAMTIWGGPRFGRLRGGVLLVIYGLIMASWII